MYPYMTVVSYEIIDCPKTGKDFGESLEITINHTYEWSGVQKRCSGCMSSIKCSNSNT